ncbi:transglutaminase domain-containing protein [Tenacibaculum ascidiaceicola]|uniref:transglutaminase domain-containing protein n=1 Tax=Tenacibaculum ascidiaceicola TaxID=1699411 RepID=UPI0039E89BF9
MKKTLFFFVLYLFFSNTILSQDLAKVDKIIYSYNGITSIKELSERIDYDFKTDIEKVRAIYTWIALNIEYDYFPSKLLKSPEFLVYNNNDDLKRIKQNKIKLAAQKTFRTKKGLCSGFAYLFHRLCYLINIENELIYGYTKTSLNQIGVIPEEKNHVWNAVKINNKWILMDVTFGSGYLYNDVWQRHLNLEYFNVKKSKLRLTHFPADIKWRTFLDQKPLKDFCYAPLYKNGFLKNKLEILAPKTGKIITSKNNRIHIKLKKNDKVKDVKYFFSSNYKIHNTQVVNKETFSSIYLKSPKKNTTLHIYVNNELSLEYKIKVN